ncbi:MAG: (2Fe-2S)-binding protein [Actinomycetota bacterium]|nr:(2Fe-2S)-binding protein [Actinomycetota bacterium]
MDITVTVNGEPFTLSVQPADVLLETLRSSVGVKSPKVGCERGDCGSCTVLLDGHSVRSCLVLSVETDGQEITTVEGLSDEGLTRLQQTLIDLNSFQCGFCAPGIVLAAAELLEEEPQPTRGDVQTAISGNLCRCTGYEPIIDAVLAAADTAEEPDR